MATVAGVSGCIPYTITCLFYFSIRWILQVWTQYYDEWEKYVSVVYTIETICKTYFDKLAPPETIVHYSDKFS